MHLFLTGVVPFLAHNHASAAAFLTCRHHNFHASIIPEFLSDEERVQSFCEARQQNQLEVDKRKPYKNVYDLFVQTPLMQFSPSLVLHRGYCVDSIVKPLLKTKYFTRSLQRCSVASDIDYYVKLTTDLLQSLSQVRSLIKLDLGLYAVKHAQLEIIINSFPSLEKLTIENAKSLDSTTTFSISSPPPTATKTLRNLTMRDVDGSFATHFVPHFINLNKLVLSGDVHKVGEFRAFELQPLSSSLPLLTDLSLERYNLKNSESLKNLGHLSSLHFRMCRNLDLSSFLSQEENASLPELRAFRLSCAGFVKEDPFESLENATNLSVLKLASFKFNNDSFKYLEKMIHLRKLDLSWTKIVGDSRSLKALMENLFQLEELNLSECDIGSEGAIAGALYSTHSRLRVLTLINCRLDDDDLNGIGALKNTLEALDLSDNAGLSSEALVHCSDLMKLKILRLKFCYGIRKLPPLTGCLNLEELDVTCCEGINDLSPLKDCSNLKELRVPECKRLTNASFKVFGKEPNSFPNLRVLDLSGCDELTEKVFAHLSKNNHLVFQLKELDVEGMYEILASSKKARSNLCQLKGLRRLYGIFPDDDYSLETPSDDDSSESASDDDSSESPSDDDSSESPLESLEHLKRELLRELKNLEGV